MANEWNNLSVSEVGKRIAAARAYSGLGLDELALRLEISAPTLRRWCNGEEQSLGHEAKIDAKVRMVIRHTNCPPEFFDLEDNGDGDYRAAERSPGFRSRLWKIEKRLDKLEAKGQECGCGGDCKCNEDVRND